MVGSGETMESRLCSLSWIEFYLAHLDDEMEWTCSSATKDVDCGPTALLKTNPGSKRFYYEQTMITPINPNT